MSAMDVFEALREIDPALLAPLERTLLITDGTLTEILEAHFLERIELAKISQRMLSLAQCGISLDGDGEEPVMERKIALRGARSGSVYIYAESLVLVGRLAPAFKDELLGTNTPLGRLWLQHRLETWKQLVSIERRQARELRFHLDCAAEAPVLARTYEVFSSRQLVMRISETFCIGEALSSRKYDESRRPPA